MLAYLYRRYGTESSVFQSMLAEILHLPFPKDDTMEEVNLAKISAITSISTTPENTLLYTMDKMKAIVNSTLKEKTRENFYDRFIDSKLTLRGSCAPEDWDFVYERDHSQHRLDFLNQFINRRLEVLTAALQGANLVKVTSQEIPLKMGTVTLAAVVLVRVVVIPKEMVAVEEEVLGDRTILLLAKLMLFLTSVISISKI